MNPLPCRKCNYENVQITSVYITNVGYKYIVKCPRCGEESLRYHSPGDAIIHWNKSCGKTRGEGMKDFTDKCAVIRDSYGKFLEKEKEINRAIRDIEKMLFGIKVVVEVPVDDLGYLMWGVYSGEDWKLQFRDGRGCELSVGIQSLEVRTRCVTKLPELLTELHNNIEELNSIVSG
jgi:hypothetical protein